VVTSSKRTILAATPGPFCGDRDVVQKLPDTSINPE